MTIFASCVNFDEMHLFTHWIRLNCLALLLLRVAGQSRAQSLSSAGPWLTLDAQTLQRIAVVHGSVVWTNDFVFNGDRALLWNYEPGGTLTIPYHGKSLGYAGHFFLAFYQDAPVPDGRHFTLEFSRGRETPGCTAAFTAKRRDWNRVELHSSETYGSMSPFGFESVNGVIGNRADTVTLRAPQDRAGQLRIGQYALAEKELVRFENVGIHAEPADCLQPELTVPAVEDREAFHTIEARVERDLLENASPEVFTVWNLAEVRRRVQRLKIQRSGEGWRGVNVTLDTRNDLGYQSEERDYCRLMAHLAWLCAQPENSAIREPLVQDYFQLWDFQRYLGGMPDSWAGGDGFVESAFLMRQALRETGRLTQEILAEIQDRLALDRIHARQSVYLKNFRNRTYRAGELGEDCDYSRMAISRLLLTILMGPDSPEKVRDLRAFSSWLDRIVFQYSPGVCDTFKPDGSVFHHQSFIPGYGSGALLALSRIVYELSATPYRVSPRGHEFIRDVVLRWRCLQREGTLPLTLGGKGGFVAHFNTAQSALPFLYLTLSGTADDRETFDAPMAGVWLRQLESAPAQTVIPALQRAAAEQCRSLGVVAEPIPSGHWTWPYAALAVHRRADWLLQMKGHSRYIYAREAGGVNNFPMVTFLGYGTLELLMAKDFKTRSFHDIDLGKPGFDWARFPGTTTPFLSPDRLKWTGWKHYNSDQAFVGGVDGPEGNGCFALSLHGAKAVNLESFYARKSWHCFGGAVVCLGSGIRSDLAKDEIGTTLFQEALGKGHEPLQLDGQPLATFPLTEQHTSTTWLMDAHGNGYEVTAGQKLMIRRSTQLSRDTENKKDTHGDWSTAWLSHGCVPKDATYSYVLLPQIKTEAMAAFHQAMLRQPPLKILRLDSAAHIVESVADQTVSYALFETVSNLTAVTAGPLRSVSRPCLVMMKLTPEGLSLHVSDPDLNLEDAGARQTKEGLVSVDDWGYSRPNRLRLVIAGQWIAPRAAGVVARSEGENTSLEISLKDGLTLGLQLKKEGGKLKAESGKAESGSEY